MTASRYDPFDPTLVILSRIKISYQIATESSYRLWIYPSYLVVLVGKKESEVEAGLGPRQYRQYRFHIKLLQNPPIAYEYIHRVLVVLVGN